ncbi:hypothetical protein BDY24DRAFT_372130 [Mrakia frigida]|uniref:glycosyltransferase domain-containing protein n=1 Tax=Mrakia frigida TaxID=29902 RepID=UPI003FCC0A2F
MKHSLRIPLILVTFFSFSILILINVKKKQDDSSLDLFPSASTPKLHFLLPATHSTPEFCKTLLTTLLHDYEPLVINWGANATGVRARQIKVKGVHEYISKNVTDPKDLIFMIDAFDVWLQQPASVLLSKYLSYPARVLIGADKRCWPPGPNPLECIDIPNSTLPSNIYGDETDTGQELATGYTFSLNRPRYPNSGTILSPHSLLLPLYTSLLAQSLTQDPETEDDQQLFLSTYFNDLNSPRSEPLSTTSPRKGQSSLHPDFESELFQTMTFSQRDVEFMRASTGLPSHPSFSSALSSPPSERLMFNRISGTLPIAVHFNGGEKKLLGEWWGRMWWVTGGEGEREERKAVREWVKRKVRKGGVTVARDGRWISWEELGCERRDGEVWGVMEK